MMRFAVCMFATGAALFSGSACSHAQAPAAPESPEGQIIRVMTFNVKVDIEVDDTCPAWSERKDLCAQVVHKADPDLLGLQETSSNQLAFFRETLPDHADVGEVALTPEETEYFLAAFPPLKSIGFTHYTDAILMYRRGLFEKLEEGRAWLSPTPEKVSTGFGNVFPRILVWARLKHKPSGLEFVAVNTHFDNSMPSQVKMAALAHQLLQPFVDKGVPLLFTGDFNTDQNRGDYSTLVSGGWRDSYTVSPLASESGRDDNVPTAAGRSRIDHIFYHGDAFSPVSWERLESPDPAKNLSDHFPVLATFRLR